MRDLINLVEARQDPRHDRDFRRWFRGSKVVDEKGAPLVVYHGTRRDFAEFEIGHDAHTANPSNTLGIFFTSSPGVADGFAMHYGKRGGDPNVRPCYLNIQRPWTINAMQFTSLFTRYSTHHQGDTSGFIETIRDNLEIKGFDGIRVTPFAGYARNPTYEFDNDVWVVFYPSQIRSMFDVKYPMRNIDEEFRDVDLWESAGKTFYIRFGKPPEGGRSLIGPAYRTDGRTHEAGLSVFRTQWNDTMGRWNILPDSERGLVGLDELMDQKRDAFLVTGDEIEDTGTDSEPLLTNVMIHKKLEYRQLYVSAWGNDPLPEEYLTESAAPDDDDLISDAVWWMQRWISGSMNDPDWAEGEDSVSVGFEDAMVIIRKTVGNRRGAAKPVLWRCLSLPKKVAQKVIETKTLPPWKVSYQSFSGKQKEALAFMGHLRLKPGHTWVLVSAKPDPNLIMWSMADLRASKNGKVGSYLLALDHWWDQDEVLVRITEPLPLLSAEIVKP